MDDVTDTVFRQVVAKCAAPDLFFTEFVNVDGLQSLGRPRLLKKLRFTAQDQPLVVQIWGNNPDSYREVAAQIADGRLAAELGTPELQFAGIDINMGCPEKGVVGNGSCSALINNRPLAAQIIAATKEGAAGRLPVSVKTRIGFNEVDFTWPEFLLQQDIAMLTIHGRTRKQMSKVPADWSAIARVGQLRDEQAPGTLIIGNGDVESREQGEALAAEHKLDGIMIGRGVFHDPYVFAQHSSWEQTSRADRIDLFLWHVDKFRTTWQQAERAPKTLNKFCKIYINGFDGAKELREIFMAANDAEELYNLVLRSK